MLVVMIKPNPLIFPVPPPPPNTQHQSLTPPPPKFPIPPQNHLGLIPCFGSFPSQPHPPQLWTYPQYSYATQPSQPPYTIPINLPIKRPPQQLRPPKNQASMGVRKSMFCVGAKNFFLAFDGGRAAPYHIIEKRGKFVGSLWLGLDSLRWVLKTWGLLRQETELKGFFRFLRTDYIHWNLVVCKISMVDLWSCRNIMAVRNGEAFECRKGSRVKDGIVLLRS